MDLPNDHRLRETEVLWGDLYELARIALSKGDFNSAVIETKASRAKAPEALRPRVDDLIRLLENKVDIN